MRFVHHFIAAAALICIGMGGISAATAADRDPRAAAAARLKIREELTADLAKGYLTRMDQYHLLIHAKDVLSPTELQGFEQTLDRIAMRQGIMRTASTPVRSGTLAPLPPPQDNTTRYGYTPSKYEEAVGRDMSDAAALSTTGVAGPSAETIPAPAGSPTVDESPAGIGQPVMQQQIEEGDPEACCDECECCPRRRWVCIDAFSGVEAFKGPMDVGNANGNFGGRVGVNGAVPIFQRMGLALQAGMAADLTNLKGSPYPFPNATIRDQIFATVGMFQRINRGEGTAFEWGFAYDWLFDDYYSDFHFGQWRVKGEYDFSPCDAIGAQASLPDHGATGVLPTILGTETDFHFRPITQGSLYWTHTFMNDATVTGRMGVAERPGSFIFGADGRVPLTRDMALTGTFTYIMPNVGAGDVGQTEEIWNVGVGIEIIPGGFFHRGSAGFRPFLPVADNGSFAMYQTQ